MSRPSHRPAPVRPVSHRRRGAHRAGGVFGRTLWWLGPLIVAGVVMTVLLVSSLFPYQPFVLYGYRVSPETVCAGAPVKSEVTRQFTADFDYLRLSETWMTVDVPGFAPGRPIEGNAAELPQAALHPTGRETVLSPLLHKAPTVPGTYRVQIIAQSQGKRFGFFPAIGSTTTYSDNTVTVLDCSVKPDLGNGDS